MYNGKYCCHGIKFQTVVCPDGLIAHSYSPVEGCRHDMTVLREFKFEEHILENQRFAGYFVYGDAAYSDRDVIGSPFLTIGASIPQHAVNATMSKVRVAVEMAYGQVLQYWAYIAFKEKMMIGKVPVAKIFQVSIVLTNCITCFKSGNAITSLFNTQPPSIEEYLQMIS